MTVTVAKRDPLDPNRVATGTNFAIDENAAACAILGKVEITPPGATSTPVPGAYNPTIGGVEDGLFNLNDAASIVDPHPCAADDVTEAKTNELRALVSFNMRLAAATS